MAKIGSLVIDLKAEIASFRTSMEKANGLLNSNVGKMRTSLNRLEKSFATVGKAVGLLQGAFLALAGVGAVGQIIKMADDYKTLQARIESVTKATGDYANVSKQLNAIAGATGSKLETTVDVFQRIQIGAKDLGKSNTEILKVVKAVQQLGALGGASTEAMNAGLLQFGQALSSGRVYAEEFNSIVENLPLVAQKIAEGFGVSVGQLKMMVKEGKVTSEQVFAVLLAKSKEVEKSFAALPPSVSRSMNDLGLTFTTLLGNIDKSTGATNTLAKAIQDLANWIKSHSNDFVGTFKTLGDTFNTIAGAISRAKKELDSFTKANKMQDKVIMTKDGPRMNLPKNQPGRAPIDPIGDAIRYFTGGAKALAPNLPQINSQSYGKIIQISDYQTRLGGALGGLNTPEQITAMGETFNQTAATMQSRVQGIEQAVQQYGRTFEGVFMDAVMNGKFNFKEFARSVLADIAQMAFRMTVIAPLFGGTTVTGKSTKGLFGNILGSIAGSLFGGGKLPGRAAGGPVSAFKPYLVGEKGPELFMPGKSGTIVPNNAMGGGGQAIQVHNHVHLTAGVPEQVRATVIAMMPQIQKAAVDGTVKAISRGGDITRAVGQKK